MTEKLIKLIDAYRDACQAVAKGDNSFIINDIAVIARHNLETYILGYKRALEGLTPGGSEFVDDPERCASYIREARDTQHQLIIKQQKELQKLRGEKC